MHKSVCTSRDDGAYSSPAPMLAAEEDDEDDEDDEDEEDEDEEDEDEDEENVEEAEEEERGEGGRERKGEEGDRHVPIREHWVILGDNVQLCRWHGSSVI